MENLHSLKNNMSTLAQILIDARYAAGEIFQFLIQVCEKQGNTDCVEKAQWL